LTRLNKNIAQVILIDSTGCLKKVYPSILVITFKNKVITKNPWVRCPFLRHSVHSAATIQKVKVPVVEVRSLLPRGRPKYIMQAVVVLYIW